METATPKKYKPVQIMVIIALFAAALLIALLALCWPFITAPDEDPDLLDGRHQAATVPTVPVTAAPAETTEATYPAETEETVPPTIPPEPNPYGRLDFQYNRHNYLYCLRSDSFEGVDVSAFQGDIDWVQVKKSGIDFAMIRLGYRGYGTGKLVEDEYARQNLRGAAEAGLAVGAYFYSQALNIDEVNDEIIFMLEVLDNRALDMPIVLDWEIPTADARTANMDARTLTDIQKHFCEKMTELGYKPMIYFNWHQSSNLYYLSELEDYEFWLALYQDRMSYPWKVEMWQYTDQGRVPGIYGNVDLNVYIPG